MRWAGCPDRFNEVAPLVERDSPLLVGNLLTNAVLQRSRSWWSESAASRIWTPSGATGFNEVAPGGASQPSAAPPALATSTSFNEVAPRGASQPRWSCARCRTNTSFNEVAPGGASQPMQAEQRAFDYAKLQRSRSWWSESAQWKRSIPAAASLLQRSRS